MDLLYTRRATEAQQYCDSSLYMFKRHGCAISNTDISEGRVWTCWDALVSYICTYLDMPTGFLVRTMFTVGLRREKSPSAVFLDNLLHLIPTLIGSILLAYKLDLHDPGKMKLRYVFVPFWTIDAIIFLAFVVSKVFIVRKQLKQNAAVENAHQRRSVVRPTLCLTMFFCLLFMPLLLFTVQLCVQDEGYYANASGEQENPISFSAVFAPLILWMAFACFAIFIL